MESKYNRDKNNMKSPKENLRSLETVARPLIQWLNENMHPHTTVIVTQTSAEVVEGCLYFLTEDYLKD
jgi:hypothetical protein